MRAAPRRSPAAAPVEGLQSFTPGVRAATLAAFAQAFALERETARRREQATEDAHQRLDTGENPREAYLAATTSDLCARFIGRASPELPADQGNDLNFVASTIGAIPVSSAATSIRLPPDGARNTHQLRRLTAAMGRDCFDTRFLRRSAEMCYRTPLPVSP